MLALLSPAALLALLGLLVPVAIHLWNRRPGREVAVGSLRWLAAGANRRLRNLKLEQLGLLLLRATLLAVLAVAVAGPMWRTALPASRGVVLLSAEAAALPALTGLKTTIDSLRRRGYALRWLAPGFPRVPGGAWQQLAAGQPNLPTDSSGAQALAGPGSLAFAWARVQQATAAFPGQPLFVVTSGALRNFGGSHAPLPAAVTWQALPDTATAAWLGAAELVGDSLHLLVGRSSETLTTYQRKAVLRPHDNKPFRVVGLAPLRMQPAKKGGTYLAFIPTEKTPKPDDEIRLDSVPTTIEIYASPTYAADARYLEAALRAAAVGLPIRPQLRRTAARPEQLSAHWTFWLSDDPLPPNWQQAIASAGRQLWRAAAGPSVADTAHLATTETNAAPVAVFRRAAQLAPGSESVWADGRGRPILSRQLRGRGAVYQLHTRLSPSWSELADDPQLPARLLELLQPEPADNLSSPPTRLAEAEAAHDHRALAPAQLPTLQAGVAHSVTAKAQPPAFRTTDLRPWLVLLAGLLLLFERLLARRRENQTLLATT